MVFPILHGSEGVEALKAVVTALDDAGGRVSRVCGLHTHLDGRNLEVRHVRSIVRRYAKFEEQIDAFMPPGQRGSQNRFCQTVQPLATNENFLRASTLKHLVAAQGGRYFKVNLQPLLSQGSLEFRSGRPTPCSILGRSTAQKSTIGSIFSMDLCANPAAELTLKHKAVA